MIKYYYNEENTEITAVLVNTTYDAAKQIRKMVKNCIGRNHDKVFIPNSKELLMNKEYKATIKLRHPDTFDPKEGMRIAKEKVMKNYYRALDRRIEWYYNTAIKPFIENADTFEKFTDFKNKSFEAELQKAHNK